MTSTLPRDGARDRAAVVATTIAQEVPKQLDIENVLPVAARLVDEILQRNELAPGYARAVVSGVAARLAAPNGPDGGSLTGNGSPNLAKR